MAEAREETRQRYVGAIQAFAAAICGEWLTWHPKRRSVAHDEMPRAILATPQVRRRGTATASPTSVSLALHRPDDVIIMELVDAQNRPVAPGIESSKVLVTHLHNRIQPLIRYEISDRVSWPNPLTAVRGSGQWLCPPRGRTDDIFR